MTADSIRIILPAASLPAEGCEPDGLALSNPEADRANAAEDLLARLTAMTQLVGTGALVVKSTPGREQRPTAMETITFSIDDDATPHLELSHASAGDGGGNDRDDDSWGAQAYSDALSRFATSCEIAVQGSACERFAECLAIAFNEGCETGIRRVPLLAERDGKVVFYGVWEATEVDLAVLSETWSGDAASGWLPVGDGDEVEGRGLREWALGAAAFSLIATSMPGQAMANVAGSDVPSMDWGASEFRSGMIPQVEEVVVAIDAVEEKAEPVESEPAPLKAAIVDMDSILDLTTYEAPNELQEGARIDLGKLAEANSDNTRIVVDVAAQRAYIVVDGQVIGDTPVSTARSGKYTPRGVFHITQKKVDKISTIYHVALPYWMRLDESAIGLHVGDLPGRPASAGCIRLPREVAQVLFSHLQRGTAVEVVDAWSDAPAWG